MALFVLISLPDCAKKKLFARIVLSVEKQNTRRTSSRVWGGDNNSNKNISIPKLLITVECF